MVKLYTKTGDEGDTSLVSGERLSKCEGQIELYGDVDELNSILGIVDCYIDAEMKPIIESIQNRLFDLGSNLACSEAKREEYKLPQLDASDIEALEGHIDHYFGSVPELKNFILPGGHQAAAFLHLARTVCRRVERKLVGEMKKGMRLPAYSINYLNRLSDLFFVLARAVNHRNNVNEVKWLPKK